MKKFRETWKNVLLSTLQSSNGWKITRSALLWGGGPYPGPSAISAGLEVIYTAGGTCPNFSNTTKFTLQTPNSEFNTWTLLPTACLQVNQGEVWSCAHGAEKGSSQQAAPGGCVQALQWRVQPEYSGKIQKRRWDWWNCFKGPRITHNS